MTRFDGRALLFAAGGLSAGARARGDRRRRSMAGVVRSSVAWNRAIRPPWPGRPNCPSSERATPVARSRRTSARRRRRRQRRRFMHRTPLPQALAHFPSLVYHTLTSAALAQSHQAAHAPPPSSRAKPTPPPPNNTQRNHARPRQPAARRARADVWPPVRQPGPAGRARGLRRRRRVRRTGGLGCRCLVVVLVCSLCAVRDDDKDDDGGGDRALPLRAAAARARALARVLGPAGCGEFW